MIEEISRVIAGVITMGGDPVEELLAPSEIRAIAVALVASGCVRDPAAIDDALPPNLSWMANLPPHLRDCFNA